MDRFVEQKQLAGAVVLVSRRGQIVYDKAFGRMDVEGDVAMRTDAIFRLYSMTKSITTAAALMLYEEGKFDLDDPVSKDGSEPNVVI